MYETVPNLLVFNVKKHVIFERSSSKLVKIRFSRLQGVTFKYFS